VFFSSHILSGCRGALHRVAIIAQGRLAGGRRLADIVGADVLGLELIADGVTPAALDLLRPRTRQVTALPDGRYALDLPPEAPGAAVRRCRPPVAAWCR
jgi:hypothetical protein